MPRRSGQTVNRADLAAIFGVVPNTVTEWVRKGCPVLSRGSHGREYQFDTAAVIKWRMDGLKEGLSKSDGREKPNFEIDRARKMQADADIAEVERDLARGSVVRISEVEDAVRAEYAVVRTRLGSLPGRLAPKVDPDRAVEIQPLIAEMVDEVLLELSADDRYAEQADGDGASAADGDSQGNAQA